MSEATDRKAIRLVLVEWVTTLGVFLTCFLFLLQRIEALEEKQDIKIQEIRQDRQAQAERSDRLYEMFIDLIKEQRK